MIKRIFKSYKLLLGGLVLLLITFLAYGKILGMYFYLEDYLVLYSIQNPDSPEAGYGSGVFGRPFGWAVTPFIPFYHLFGLEPQGYYLIEVLLYFAASISVYFFAKTFTGNKKAAFGSALIFASGYVGSGSLYRMAVGWQNLLAAIFISLSAALYFKYVKTPKLKYYVLAFAVYLVTCEFSFYRAHGIVLLILGIELLFNFNRVKSIARMTPFALAYYYFYVYSLPNIDQVSKTASFVRIVFQERNYHYLLTPLKTLQNLFIPDRFSFPLFVFAVVLTGVLLWKRSKVLLYCLIFAVANFLVYFYYSPNGPQETTHRYLTVSFVGIASFLGIFLNAVFKNKGRYFLACLLIVAFYITLARQEQAEILQNRSIPNREFWRDFRKNIGNIPPKSVIYIDTKNDGLSKPVRDTSLSAGSMSATASFAMFYRLKWEDIYLAENFPEVLSLVKSKKVEKDNIFTFYYSRDGGLVNTTQISKKTISQGGELAVADINNINIPFTSPVLFNFDSVVQIDYSDFGKAPTDADFSIYLDYLSSKKDYYKNVSVSASSEVKYAEVKNISDDVVETSWRADDLKWAASHHEELVVNLGRERKVGKVKITPANSTRTPTDHAIECSSDLKVWSSLKTPGDQTCAFVKIIITTTASGGPPQISEIEVVESPFANLDISKAEEVEKNPFNFVSLQSNYLTTLKNYFAKYGVQGTICVHTDKYNSQSPLCEKHSFRLGNTQDYILINQGGTILKKVEIRVPEPVKVNFGNIRANYLTYDELEKMNYIFP